MNTFVKLMKDENGATAIEYGLIAALVAVMLIVALRYLGDQLSATFNYVGDNLANARSSGAAKGGF